MISDENGQFFMVANAEREDGLPVPFLVNPPRAVQSSVTNAEQEAVRLAKKTGKRFVVLQAVAYVEVVNGVPKWEEL